MRKSIGFEGGFEKVKDLSLSEFVETCERLNLARYIFDTENQDENGAFPCLEISSSYSDVDVSWSLDMICFKRDQDILCLENVQKILYDDETDFWVTFEIICKPYIGEKSRVSYKILAVKKK